MSWRTVVISSKCKLTYKNNYMIIRNDEMKMVHLGEINTLVIDTVLVSITTVLMCELLNRKIKIIFCDEKHNPKGEVISYYGSHNTSKKVIIQSSWGEEIKGEIWRSIVIQKIKNQNKVLELYEKINTNILIEYVKEVQAHDITNREGHAAKVYFNSLFGIDFTRNDVCNINSALDYGYTILLSAVNREVVSNGYITQLGINHKNEFNQFNLSCDLMEPFRPLVDKVVYENKNFILDKEFKYRLINVLNDKIYLDGNEYYVSNAIQTYIKNVFKVLENGDFEKLNRIDII